MFVFSNLAISIDGKIATADRSHFPLGTPKDRQQMQVLRKRADAVLMGASSLRAFRKPLFVFEKGKKARRQILNVIVSSSLKGISPEWPFFTEPSVRRLIFVSRKLPARRLREFEKNSEIVFLPREGSWRGVAGTILRELAKRGIRKLLVEGGGGVMWDFVSEDLIDEFNVTITPWVLGGAKAPTLVDGKGFLPSEVLDLKLKSCRKVGDELFLVYRRPGKRG